MLSALARSAGGLSLQDTGIILGSYLVDGKSSNERLAKAQQIASNPDNYQVCEGCESIVGTSALVCPNCHGYRFDCDPLRVVDQALILGSREKRSVTAEDLS